MDLGWHLRIRLQPIEGQVEQRVVPLLPLVAVVVLGVVGPVCGQERVESGSAVAASATSPSAPQPSSTLSNETVGAEDYVISPDDELQIDVVDVPEISRVYRVSSDGSVTLPLLPDPIRASGLTVLALSRLVGEQLKASGMVSHPHVTVQVKDSRLHTIAIMGAVKRPQIYPVFGKTTLMDALSKAEGLAENAGATAIVTRGDIAMRTLRSAAGGASSAPTPRRSRWI